MLRRSLRRRRYVAFAARVPAASARLVLVTGLILDAPPATSSPARRLGSSSAVSPGAPSRANEGLEGLRVVALRRCRRHARVDHEACVRVGLAVALTKCPLRSAEEGQHNLCRVVQFLVLLDGLEPVVVDLGFQDVIQHRRGHHDGPPLDLHQLSDALLTRGALFGQGVEAVCFGAVVAEDTEDGGSPADFAYRQRLLDALPLRVWDRLDDETPRTWRVARLSVRRLVVVLDDRTRKLLLLLLQRRHHRVLPRRHRDLPEGRRGQHRRAGAVGLRAHGELHGLLVPLAIGAAAGLALQRAVLLEGRARDLVLEGDPLLHEIRLRRCILRRELTDGVVLF
mmetsp:Transcript_37007/g.92909  ORF Transcript_37007/g.92909 Transcript_37007/m.92909 type:complete len:339 (+) Transcript_37007:800-1816(+)